MHQQRMNERIEWVDAYKGLAIIYVLLGHVICFLSPIVYVFHMNAFFFISGYTTSIKETRFGDYFSNKFTALIIPCITINIFFQLLVVLLKYLGLQNVFFSWDSSYDSIFQRIPQVIFLLYTGIPELGGALWFLKVLFFTSIIAKLFSDLSTRMGINDYVTLLFAFLLLVCGYFIYQKVYLIYELELCFTSVFYFLGGRLFAEKDTFNKISAWYAVPLTICLLYYFTHINNMEIDYSKREFKNPLLSVLASLAGIYLTFFLSKVLLRTGATRNLIKFMGRKTLSIMAMHFLAFKIIFLVLYCLGFISALHLRDMVPPSGNNYWHVLAFLSIVLVLFWDYLLQNSTYAGYVLLGNNRKVVHGKLKELAARLGKGRFE